MASKSNKPMPPLEYLHKLFEYKDGALYWKIARSNCIKVGDIAGHVNDQGYMKIKFDGIGYLSHRLIFFMHHKWVPEFLDHIDGNRLNNNIDNLRPATKLQNLWNRGINRNNKSGVKGVHWCSRDKKWIVQVSTDAGKRCLGYFDDLELADLVAQEARHKYHGEYARHA